MRTFSFAKKCYRIHQYIICSELSIKKHLGDCDGLHSAVFSIVMIFVTPPNFVLGLAEFISILYISIANSKIFIFSKYF